MGILRENRNIRWLMYKNVPSVFGNSEHSLRTNVFYQNNFQKHKSSLIYVKSYNVNNVQSNYKKS